ncbi:hypothetical protein [Hoeflea sp.]|uniref:hypothetical protein n=1 Tax=Hoeflea sp. TaxID=1940281 RepID=UPI0019BD168B|nr:hypothetical protein [Hoeflea sp.]MBC7283489.1 hypothetical protein [Hoeflea sp.]
MVIAAEQRLTIDAVRVTADLAAAAYCNLVEVALATASENDAGASTALVLHAWSFVDQLYAVRKLLERLGEVASGPRVTAFLDVSSEAAHLRNRTDHLHSKISNISAKKDAERSLFGCVSYCLDPELAGHSGHDALLVSHQIEPVRPGEAFSRGRTPGDDLRLPCGNFFISADGRVLDLDSCVTMLSALIRRMNETVEAQTAELIERLSLEHGVPKEKLRQSYGTGMRTEMLFRRPTAAEAEFINQLQTDGTGSQS